jgi:hypothetical protein
MGNRIHPSLQRKQGLAWETASIKARSASKGMQDSRYLALGCALSKASSNRVVVTWV